MEGEVGGEAKGEVGRVGGGEVWEAKGEVGDLEEAGRGGEEAERGGEEGVKGGEEEERGGEEAGLPVGEGGEKNFDPREKRTSGDSLLFSLGVAKGEVRG